MNVLVGDIGGTNSRLALYDAGKPVFERTYPSAGHPSLESAVKKFLGEAAEALGSGGRPSHACLAVAGPVSGGTARITNLPWVVDERRLAAETGIVWVRLVNDFEAAARGVPLLGSEHLIPLGGGPPDARGPIVVVGPGTGLGQGFLLWSEAAGRYEVAPSEGGHADFAPRTPLERALASALATRHGHVSVERVLSGPGLADILAFLRAEPAAVRLARPDTLAAIDAEGSDDAPVIVRQAVAGADPLCVLAVQLFASILGAHAGNLALTVLATGGVFIAGGIPPRLASLLPASPLREAFEDKGRLAPVLKKIPIYVVTHRELGLLGAAALASRA